NAKDSSPAANSRTSRLASRRSVFTRSPEAPGDRSRRHDSHIEAALLGNPGEHEPGGASLIHRAHRAIELLQEVWHDMIGLTAQPLHTQLTVDRIQDRRDRLGPVHIEPERAILSDMVGTSHSWGVGARPILTPSPRTSMRGVPADLSSSAGEPTLHRVYAGGRGMSLAVSLLDVHRDASAGGQRSLLEAYAATEVAGWLDGRAPLSRYFPP